MNAFYRILEEETEEKKITVYLIGWFSVPGYVLKRRTWKNVFWFSIIEEKKLKTSIINSHEKSPQTQSYKDLLQAVNNFKSSRFRLKMLNLGAAMGTIVSWLFDNQSKTLASY